LRFNPSRAEGLLPGVSALAGMEWVMSGCHGVLP
jgi:hypothetical protein